MAAIESRNSPKVQQLLKEGVDPNIRTTDGETILQLAVSSVGNEKIVRALLNAGAEVDARDGEDNSPLIVCVDDDRIKTAQLLIDHGADVDAKNDAGDTPLTNAACWGSAKCVAALLKHRANPRIADGRGVTALSLAEQHHHASIARMLIKAIDAVAIG